MQIIFTFEESLQHFHTALCNSARYLEGYGLELDWDDKQYKIAKEKLTAPCYQDILIQILKDGGTLTYNDIEGEGENTKSITVQDVYDRLPKTPIRHLADLISENDDASTGDAVLQTIFFNDIIFG